MIVFYADEDIPLPLVKALRLQGIKVLTTQDSKMLGRSDEEQLQFAASKGIVLLSHNTKDFVKLHQKFLAEGENHSGIVVSRKDTIGVLLKRILHLTFTLKADDMKNRLECQNFKENSEHDQEPAVLDIFRKLMKIYFGNRSRNPAI